MQIAPLGPQGVVCGVALLGDHQLLRGLALQHPVSYTHLESFKDDAIAACEDVRWVPSWGKDRLRSMVLELSLIHISNHFRGTLTTPKPSNFLQNSVQRRTEKQWKLSLG